MLAINQCSYVYISFVNTFSVILWSKKITQYYFVKNDKMMNCEGVEESKHGSHKHPGVQVTIQFYQKQR